VRLPDDPDSVEFLLAVAKLDETPIGPPPEDKTFKVLIRRYLESTDFGDLAASTKSEYRRHIKYIEPVLGPFLVAGIRPTHAEALKQKFSQTPTLAKAVGRTISVLLGFAAYPLEWIPRNPLVNPKRGGAAKRKQKAFGYKPLEEAEISSFREAVRLGARARLAFEIGLGTGLRREDICKVPASAMAGKTFSMFAGKNGVLLVLPVTELFGSGGRGRVHSARAPEKQGRFHSESGSIPAVCAGRCVTRCAVSIARRVASPGLPDCPDWRPGHELVPRPVLYVGVASAAQRLAARSERRAPYHDSAA
jgi:hypothetical protein